MNAQVVQAINEDITRISSREVSQMMNIRHDNLMAKIEKHIGIFKEVNDLKNKVVDYWVASTYKDAKGEVRKEYQISKKGCEFLAHKTTGEKGDLFTVKYMERFEQMEKQLKNPFAGLSKELQAIFTLDSKQQEQDKRLTEIENKMTINYELSLNIQNAIKFRAIEVLGGKDSGAYKKLSSKVFSKLHKDLKNTFKVNSYKNLSVKSYDNAINFIRNWELKDEVLIYAIEGLNGQLAFA